MKTIYLHMPYFSLFQYISENLMVYINFSHLESEPFYYVFFFFFFNIIGKKSTIPYLKVMIKLGFNHYTEV